jgi:hypothetical protein
MGRTTRAMADSMSIRTDLEEYLFLQGETGLVMCTAHLQVVGKAKPGQINSIIPCEQYSEANKWYSTHEACEQGINQMRWTTSREYDNGNPRVLPPVF